MATLQQRIEGYVGAITGSTNAIQDAMSSEARILIDVLPAFDLIQDGASDTATILNEQSQFAVDNVRILDVMVSYPMQVDGLNGPYRARQISRSESGRMRDAGGLYYRPTLVTDIDDPVRDPVYFIEKIEIPAGDTYSHVRTIPQPSDNTNEVNVIIEYVPYPSINLSDANLYEIPKKILQALVYYGAIEELSYRQGVAIKDLETALYDSKITDILTIDYAGVVSALADDDFEKVQSELSYITTQINEYTKGLETTQTEISDAANTYTDGINRLAKRLESINAERASIAALYQQELQKIGAVSRQVQQ